MGGDLAMRANPVAAVGIIHDSAIVYDPQIRITACQAQKMAAGRPA